MRDCPACAVPGGCLGSPETPETARVRAICDDAYALIGEAYSDAVHGTGVRVPMLLRLACARLKDNDLTTPEPKKGDP